VVQAKRKVYHVYGKVTGGSYLGQVMAHSKEEAEQIAWDGKKLDLGIIFCHQCAHYCENAEISEITVEEG
jgi:hypothetical protein